MNIFFLPNSTKVLPLFKHFAQMGPEGPDGVSFCPLSSPGQAGSASRNHGVLARGQVAVYRHLSIGPQGRNPLFCRSASVFHSRSARYN